MELGLKGRSALLTASSRGIGLAVAREFADEGARLLITGRGEESLAAAREVLAASGAEVHTMVGDVADEASCQAMVARAEELFGSVEVLFASSGGPPAGGFEDHGPEAYRGALDLNLLSIVHLCRAAVPGMVERGWGRVVALTSISVKQPVEGLLLSNTARAGAQGFLKSLANEVGTAGVTVNTVCPGYTGTERLAELAAAVAARRGVEESAVTEEWARSTPARRIGSPEEVAAVVAFLASERASYVNGAAIAVDGGAVRSLL